MKEEEVVLNLAKFKNAMIVARVSVKAYEVRLQICKEYLSGEKTEYSNGNVAQKIDLCIN